MQKKNHVLLKPLVVTFSNTEHLLIQRSLREELEHNGMRAKQ